MNDSLIESIAAGKANLLTADDICKRLSISRSTFDRWVRNSAPIHEQLQKKQEAKGEIAQFLELMVDPMEKADKTSFPQADIRIGNSPRWSIETFKAWLKANIT